MAIGRSVCIAFVAIAVLAAVSPRTASNEAADLETRERYRIQAHFDSVLTELRGRDVATLTAVHRQRRAELVSALVTYRDAGAFPHNYDLPRRMVPVFVDPVTGVRCAMGELLHVTGRDDIVDRVVTANRNVYVMELQSDTGFTAWLDDHGLTVAEAARIQPSYNWSPPLRPHDMNTPIVVAGITSLGLTITNFAGAPQRRSRAVSALGLGIGLATTLLSTEALRSRRADAEIGALGIAAGAVSAVTSVATMKRDAKELTAGRKLDIGATLLPGAAAPPRVGFSARLRF